MSKQDAKQDAMKYLKAMKSANAVGSENAKTLEELGLEDGNIINDLLKHDMIASMDGKYYIPEKLTKDFRYKRI